MWLAIIVFLIAAAVIWWGTIAFGKLFNHLEGKVNKGEGTTIVGGVDEILTEELQKKLEGKQKTSLDKLRKKVGSKGIMTCELDQNNKVRTDTIEWLGADQREQEVQELLDQEDGLLVLEH